MLMTVISYHKNALYADKRVMVQIGNELLKKTSGCKIYKDISGRFAFAHTGDIHNELMQSAIMATLTTRLSLFYENINQGEYGTKLVLDDIPVKNAGQYIIMTRDHLWMSDKETKVDVKEVSPEHTYAMGSGASVFQMGVALGLKPPEIFSDLENHVSTCSNNYDVVLQKSLYKFKQIK